MTVVVPNVPTPVPSRADPVNFAERADAYHEALPVTIAALNLQNAENNSLNNSISDLYQAALSSGLESAADNATIANNAKVLAQTKAGEASGYAAQALAIYGSVGAQQTAVAQAAAQASLAAGYAASASSVVQQDLSGVTAAALHRSPNAVTAMFIYDTSKDSDGGAWTEKCQHTSWYNESLNGRWLGAQPSEIFARNEGATLGSNLFVNGDFSNGTTGWTTVGASVNFDGVVDGRAKIVVVSNFGAGSGNGIKQTVTTVIGKTYRVSATVESTGSGSLDIYVLNGAVVVSSSSKSGTVECFFSAASTSTEIRIGFNGTGEVIGDVGYVDNALIREAIATTQPGDYFQLTTDGKFYKLNATSGTNEVFRGNKRDFPRLAAIVAEAASVTIYDLTEPGRPMWMRFVASGTMEYATARALLGPNSQSSLAALNGYLVTGCTTNNGYQGSVINFARERVDYLVNGATGSFNGNLAQRNDARGFAYSGGYVINNSVSITAVAMTVLPDAPVDPVTGLKVPTIAVATSGGVSVIKHNGTVVTNSGGGNYTSIAIVGATLLGRINQSAGTWLYATTTLGSLAANFTMQGMGGQFSAEWGAIKPAGQNVQVFVGGGNRINTMRLNRADANKPVVSSITNTFNTGHMTGDIRRAYLADVEAGSVTTPSELVTNGGFSSATGWTFNGNASFDTDRARFTSGGDVIQSLAWAAGRLYYATFDIVEPLTGTLTVYFGGSPVATFATGSSGTKTVTAVKGAFNNNLQFTVASGGNGAIDNISVRELLVPDRSYKAQGASITGTLTKTPIALGSQLVAYSGFSA